LVGSSVSFVFTRFDSKPDSSKAYGTISKVVTLE
ncbi:unnamed protein product, partial [marine sediment metagenome]